LKIFIIIHNLFSKVFLKVSTKVFENTILWVLKKVFSKFIPTKKVLHTQKLCVEEKIFEKDFFGIFKVLFTLKNDFSTLKILNSNNTFKKFIKSEKIWIIPE
jgi:hypothetical protein